MADALYRRKRPQTFQEVIGQDPIRDTLVYALNHGGLHHAYLLCGPRGTGKTTTARLIAKTINCTSADGKPCNQCPSCHSITDGSNLDILEIDAASNRGIDDIRSLRERVQIRPTQAQYKVFIIDEVHMLTREAFNALLKTLEEPPVATVFVLATTEPHKVPATILSRCQRYDFKRATPDTLATRIMAVASEENIPLDETAAAFLARLGDGSFRDALSLLEQVSQLSASQQKKDAVITRADVETLFGYIPEAVLNQCIAGVLGGDRAVAHTTVDAMIGAGADFSVVIRQLLIASELLLEAKITGDTTRVASELIEIADATPLARLVAWIEQLITATSQLKTSPIPRLPLDLAIAKSLPADTAPMPSPDSPKRPTAATTITTTVPAPSPTKPTAAPDPPATPPAAPAEESEAPPVQEMETVEVVVEVPTEISQEEWQQVLTKLSEDSPSLVTCLISSRCLGIKGGIVRVENRYKMHAEKINQPKNRAKIEAALAAVFSAPLQIAATANKDLPKNNDNDTLALAAEVFDLQESA